MEYSEIKLHKSKLIVNWYGVILEEEIRKHLESGMIVRISLYVSKNSEYDDWDYDFDSPYVKLHSRDTKNNLFLGEILSINRKDDDYKYPIRTGDRIWLSADNVIEVPIIWQYEELKPKLYKYVNKDDNKVSVTGPLYTIDPEESEYEEGSDDESEEDSDESSSSNYTEKSTDADDDVGDSSSDSSESDTTDTEDEKKDTKKIKKRAKK